MRSLIAALTLLALGLAAILAVATANVTHRERHPPQTTPAQCTPPCVAPTCVRT